MATPPPEAAPVLKEDKPQLPPSPVGVSASVQNAVVDIKSDASTDAIDAYPSAVNGHAPNISSIANGTTTTASPPKSPAPLAPVDNQVSSSLEQGKAPSTMQPDTTEEMKNESPEEKTRVTQESATPGATDVSADNVFAPSVQAPTDASSMPAETTDSSADWKLAVDTPQPASAPASVKTELPPYPTFDGNGATPTGTGAPESAPPMLPPSQTDDHEMKDVPEVPASPTKIPREREGDANDEPSAKRTKVDGEDTADFKVPELPTPATETPGPTLAGGESGITKMQHKFLSKSLTSLKRMQDSRYFREPVDPIKLGIPSYSNIITQPMDLSTIEKKLRSSQYPSPQAVFDDFNIMIQNSLTFNGPEHIVTQEGQKLKATFDKQMTNLPKPDEVEEKKPKKVAEKTQAARREPRISTGSRPKATSPQGTIFPLGPEGLPLIRRDSSNPDGRPKRSIHPPKRDLPYSTKPKKKKYQWELKFCQEVLDELHKTKHYSFAYPFYQPVDPVALNIPTYHSVIKKPMDLQTAQDKLKHSQYENAKEFRDDVKQIFTNCYKFNIKGDPTYIAGQQLEEVFDTKWAQKAAYLRAHEPHPAHSDSSEVDSDEDEDESEEDDDRQIGMLQKQIAEMSRHLEAMTQQKKKKTPPSSKKAGKKSGKKDSKKSGAGIVAKKDKKSQSVKSQKNRYVSYDEKQMISNGITSLPDKKMQRALQIIQENVPSLKGTQEAEIELDIDELPNHVLLMLLDFVKKNVSHIAEDEDTAPVSSAAAPKPKKNKPMSKYEQEAQINMLESNLSRFQGQSPDVVPSVEATMESSDDEDEDSEESEEE